MKIADFTFLLVSFLAVMPAATAQQSTGARSFGTRCSVCHGGDGNGSERAPAIVDFVASNGDAAIAALIRKGVRAMPPHMIADAEMGALVAHLHTLRATPRGASKNITAALENGGTLQGQVLNQSNFDLQLATIDGKIHLLATATNGTYREKSLLPKMDWPRYDGSLAGNRDSPLDQINTTNAQRLTLKWMFPVPDAPRLESTPIVVDGVMYVTAVNAVYALDATNGRQLWAYQRAATPGLLGEASGGANRGVVVEGDRVFMLTDNAHLLALQSNTGKLLWDKSMTDWPKSQYSATGAPLVIGDLVFAGVAGGEEGARGFLGAYRVSTGEEVWRFWTIPKRGEKLAETWIGNALEHGCGATWLSGSYDPELDLLYWAVGNPCPDFNGAERKGDNLYTDSVLALKPKTGELKWYYQFTPHDNHDWDATEPLLLVDELFQGQPRKLLVQANRNGFFFVLDRSNGEFLLAKAFTKSTWASGYTKQGRPILLPNSDPSPQGTLECPDSGTNWMSASYNPPLKLFFFAASDTCAINRVIPAPFEMGSRFFNGARSAVGGGKRSIRAIDIQTGNGVWDYPQTAGRRSSAGTLSTNGGLVFIGEDSGLFTALDGRTGKALWHFPANQVFRASPMTYMVGGKQYVSIAGPAGFLTFGLQDQ